MTVRRFPTTLLLGALLVGGLLVTAIIGALLPAESSIAINIAARLQPLSPAHPFGTDQYGRDLLQRIAAGAPIAASIALGAVGIALIVGGTLGALAGFYGGWLGEIFMRASDALQAFPALLLALTVIAALGTGEFNAMIAIGVVGIPLFARLVRASVLAARTQDYVLAARSIGGDDARILRRHILPNALSPIIVQASIALGNAMLAEAGLSYLGLGTRPPQPSWGRMLEEARTFWDAAPWMAILDRKSVV